MGTKRIKDIIKEALAEPGRRRAIRAIAAKYDVDNALRNAAIYGGHLPEVFEAMAKRMAR